MGRFYALSPTLPVLTRVSRLPSRGGKRHGESRSEGGAGGGAGGGHTGGRAAWAAPADVATVVLHVVDLQKVPAGELADAQKTAARAYARIGVRLVWSAGSAAIAARDGALHLDVVILDAAMTANRMAPASALGAASREAKRAYIFYPQVVAHAMRNSGDPARTLAYALAHEVGHMLLPEYSHASDGLMRATTEGRIVNIPNFTSAQASTIQALLVSTN